jgi:GH35 family endo-1,4-beta-xylanase
LYLGRYGGDARGLATMERAAQMARDARVKWTREDFLWGRIESHKGEFDWTYYDHLVACAKRNGITVYGIACYWSAWTKLYTQEGADDYIRYLKAMVGHYQKDIKNWKIWNEPKIFFRQGLKELYAELLTRSYLCAIVSGVEPRTFWYDFRNDGDNPINFEH